MNRSYLYLGTLAVFVAALAHSSILPESLTLCADEADDALRLACYDREVGRTTTAVVVAAPDSEAAEDAAVTMPRLPEEEFGMTADLERKASEPVDDLNEIRATIVKITTRRYGNRVFTLDNGQVWLEKSEERSLRLNTGDPVRIVSGALGSFKLFGSGKRPTKVERIQ
jgi:hypothetical protein